MNKKWEEVDSKELKVGDKAKVVCPCLRGGGAKGKIVSRNSGGLVLLVTKRIWVDLSYPCPECTWYRRKPKTAKLERPAEPEPWSFFRVDRTGETYQRWIENYIETGVYSPSLVWDEITEPGDTITMLELTEAGVTQGLHMGHTAKYWHHRFKKQLAHNIQLETISKKRRLKMQRLKKEHRDAKSTIQFWQSNYAELVASTEQTRPQTVRTAAEYAALPVYSIVATRGQPPWTKLNSQDGKLKWYTFGWMDGISDDAIAVHPHTRNVLRYGRGE